MLRNRASAQHAQQAERAIWILSCVPEQFAVWQRSLRELAYCGGSNGANGTTAERNFFLANSELQLIQKKLLSVAVDMANLTLAVQTRGVGKPSISQVLRWWQ